VKSLVGCNWFKLTGNQAFVISVLCKYGYSKETFFFSLTLVLTDFVMSSRYTHVCLQPLQKKLFDM
jgi:hypothetical protein